MLAIEFCDACWLTAYKEVVILGDWLELIKSLQAVSGEQLHKQLQINEAYSNLQDIACLAEEDKFIVHYVPRNQVHVVDQ